MPIPLSRFKNRLPTGNVVATVTVEEHDPSKSVSDHVVDQSTKHVKIVPRSSRQRAWKIDVMVRITKPHQRAQKWPVRAEALKFYG